MAEDILIPLFFFVFTFLSIFIYVNSGHRERMALIERGVDTNKFYKRSVKNHLFKFGFLLIGSGLGLLLGMIFAPWLVYGDFQIGVIISSTLFFGGAFIIIGYFVEIKLEKKKIEGKIVELED
ncbi:MAG: DUF6249 domain-containing protein [Candidatus Kapabacteria bacterium]|nr:DUF6249 domain-containing protein [Candidatus Kapabacteria bacterium]